ncbi:hypothetical protein CO613_10235 [Lysobacteraceae bacterium NML07-0707]|nr:hypothetical protein CO613_10235 [Xanthomonadaceae bacterium NML07-0707]
MAVAKIYEWAKDFASEIVTALSGGIGGIVTKALSFFGLSMISFKVLLPQLKAFVMQFVSGMPAEAAQFLGAIGLGQAMSMVFSALTIRFAWKVLIVPKAAADAVGSQ